MTAQSMEKLIYNDRKVNMVSEPLASYLGRHKDKLPFFAASSGCWRGYVGSWEIKDKKLYLIGIDGYAEVAPKTYGPVGMNYLFPNQQKVFADWFTGEIRIPDGEMLNYAHMGFSSIYELDILLEFKNGQLIGKRIIDNLPWYGEVLMNKYKKDESKKSSFLTRLLSALKKER